MSFVNYKQLDQMDCGPTCLRIVTKYYGRNYKAQTLRQLCEISKEGVSLLGISYAAEKIGFRCLGVKLNTEKLKEAELPCILHWRQNHFIVLYKIKGEKFFLSDPSSGLISLSEHDFNQHWVSALDTWEGIALLLSTTPAFYDQENEKSADVNWNFLFRYLIRYKTLVLQLLFGLGIGSLLQLITPFLTQSVVDIGINTRNLNFVYIILIAQAMLIVGRVSVEFIRSWILLHISTRVNVSILTDFLIKLMKLPMGFFDSKMTGDIMQRMNDQRRIESFLTGSTLTTLFSLFNLIVFSVVLVYYNTTIFFVFIVSSIFYSLWIIVFLKTRRSLWHC